MRRGVAAVVIHSVCVFGRPEDDERDELLADVVEAVDGVGRHEDDRSGHDRAILVADEDPAAPRDDVVDLVLGVRALRICGACRQDVQPDREIVAPDELVVGLAGLPYVFGLRS